MSGKPIPTDSWLNRLDVWRVVRGRKIWIGESGETLYSWDSLHGEVEAFTKLGDHIGVLDALTGELIGGPVRGRRINVS